MKLWIIMEKEVGLRIGMLKATTHIEWEEVTPTRSKRKKHLCFECFIWARGQGLSFHVSHPHLLPHCPLKGQFLFQPPTAPSIIRLNSFQVGAPESEDQDPWKRNKWRIFSSEYSRITRSSVTMWQRIRYECWNCPVLDLRLYSATNYFGTLVTCLAKWG